jgi:hypothetical protein
MAKSTALQLVNKILSNLGESQLSSLTGLSGISLLVFNTLNEVLYEIAFEYKYSPLEEDGTITLLTGTSTYTVPTDMYAFDKDSFRYNEEKEVKYYTPQRFDREYVTQTNTGIPDKIWKWKDYWRPYPIPSSSANNKTIKYRYWTFPTTYATATPSGTSWIPEGFDITMLADYVTFKIMHYKHNEEAPIYYAKVWGDGKENEGSLARFKRLYGSPDILDENLMVEPM